MNYNLWTSTGAFHPAAQNGADSDGPWRPPGKCVKKYTRNGQQFAIYCSSLLDPAAREILQNMRIFVPLFIEGGTPCYYLDDPDWSLSRWRLFLQYEVKSPVGDDSYMRYSLAGFSTSYRLWIFPDRTIQKAMGAHIPSPPPSPEPSANTDRNGEYRPQLPFTREPGPTQSTPPPEGLKVDSEEGIEQLRESSYSVLEAPSRERISQFIILPPYQGSAHGSALYDTMVDMFRADKWVYEIPVEDPNEDFDALRDYQDLAHLHTIPDFTSLAMKSDVPSELLKPDEDVPIDFLVDQDLLDRLRHQAKIEPRQFARLVEMQLLSSVPVSSRSTARLIRKEKSAKREDRMFWFWRLYVKARIYIKNADQLVQLDEEERGPKVAEAVEGQFEEYEERLKVFEKRQRRAMAEAPEPTNGATAGSSSPEAKRKGKRKVIEEDDEDEEEVEAVNGSKRAKVS